MAPDTHGEMRSGVSSPGGKTPGRSAHPTLCVWNITPYLHPRRRRTALGDSSPSAFVVIPRQLHKNTVQCIDLPVALQGTIRLPLG